MMGTSTRTQPNEVWNPIELYNWLSSFRQKYLLCTKTPKIPMQLLNKLYKIIFLKSNVLNR
jgi:hypothetical protein